MKIVDVILTIGFLVIVILGYFSLQQLKADGSVCINNPLEYSVKRYADNDIELMCSCSFPNSQYTPVIIDKEGIRPLIPNQENIKLPIINFSIFNNAQNNSKATQD